MPAGRIPNSILEASYRPITMARFREVHPYRVALICGGSRYFSSLLTAAESAIREGGMLVHGGAMVGRDLTRRIMLDAALAPGGPAAREAAALEMLQGRVQ